MLNFFQISGSVGAYPVLGLSVQLDLYEMCFDEIYFGLCCHGYILINYAKGFNFNQEPLSFMNRRREEI